MLCNELVQAHWLKQYPFPSPNFHGPGVGLSVQFWDVCEVSSKLEPREFSSELLREFSSWGSRTDNPIFLLAATPYVCLPKRSFMQCYQTKVLAADCSKADSWRLGLSGRDQAHSRKGWYLEKTEGCWLPSSQLENLGVQRTFYNGQEGLWRRGSLSSKVSLFYLSEQNILRKSPSVPPFLPFVLFFFPFLSFWVYVYMYYCLFVCVSRCTCTCLLVRVEVEVRCQGLALNLELTDCLDWPCSELQGSCLHSPSAGNKAVYHCTWLFYCCEELKLGPHICMANTLLTEPFPGSHSHVS